MMARSSRMKAYSEEISWKGIGDYLSAARTLTEHGSANTTGPRIHCQGLALELALKFWLWDSRGSYPGTHDLEELALAHCQSIGFTADEARSIGQLNRQYLKDGALRYPSRYRPASTRAVTSPTQSAVERMIARIVGSTSRSDLVKRILSR